jgi:alkanesulfonate monooxygenase SsuD/methylene tetrahydromethanopterin reductase-like flavin-dependent oxidoreductase (luciferase family)
VTRAPFGSGSISLGLHPVVGLPAATQVDELLRQAVEAERVGFDGITISEHHGGFPGYLPQPLLAVNWFLAVTERTWAAAAPTILGLRSPRLFAEELAWTAARFPGRVSAAFVPGYARSDFAALAGRFDDRLVRFPGALTELIAALLPDGALADDAAVRAWSGSPAQLLVGANSTASAVLAALNGLGVLFPGGEDAARLRTLATAYREAGGHHELVCIASVMIIEAGPAPRADTTLFAEAAAPGMRQAHGFARPPFIGAVGRIVDELAAHVATAGATAVNLRVAQPTTDAVAVLKQIEALGSLLPELRAAITAAKP